LLEPMFRCMMEQRASRLGHFAAPCLGLLSSRSCLIRRPGIDHRRMLPPQWRTSLLDEVEWPGFHGRSCFAVDQPMPCRSLGACRAEQYRRGVSTHLRGDNRCAGQSSFRSASDRRAVPRLLQPLAPEARPSCIPLLNVFQLFEPLVEEHDADTSVERAALLLPHRGEERWE
jgi:hypothetical protein